MLHINKKFKPVMTKPVMEQEYTTPSIQGKGLNELISKIKDLKIKEKKETPIKYRLVKKYNCKLKYLL
jgi:hypothetical protein